MTTTNTKIETKATRNFDIRDYMPSILAIKKNTLKFNTSSLEELSDITDYLFNQRLTNINENIALGFSDNKNYQSKIQVRSNGKYYTIYSNVSDSKLRLNLGKVGQ